MPVARASCFVPLSSKDLRALGYPHSFWDSGQTVTVAHEACLPCAALIAGIASQSATCMALEGFQCISDPQIMAGTEAAFNSIAQTLKDQPRRCSEGLHGVMQMVRTKAKGYLCYQSGPRLRKVLWALNRVKKIWQGASWHEVTQ